MTTHIRLAEGLPPTDDPGFEIAWSSWRLDGIGSSDVAAAYTGDYGGAYAAIAKRIGIGVPDSEEIDATYAERGHAWEHALADGVAAHRGYYVVGEQACVEHPDHPERRATPDGFLATTPTIVDPDVELAAGAELKTRVPLAPWRWGYWIAQSQWMLHVTGLPKWLLVIATVDTEVDQDTGHLLEETVTDVRYRWIYPDQAVIDDLVALAEWMLDHVAARTLPEPQDHYALPWVKQANIDSEVGAEADIDDLGHLIERRDAVVAAAKALKEERAEIEARIRARMGRAREAMTSDGVWRVRVGEAVRKFTKRSAADFLDIYEERLREDHPEVFVESVDWEQVQHVMSHEYDGCRYPTNDRRLTTKQMREEVDHP